MEDMFTPMYGNVFTVFDFIALTFGNIGNLLQGLISGVSGLLGNFLPL